MSLLKPELPDQVPRPPSNSFWPLAPPAPLRTHPGGWIVAQVVADDLAKHLITPSARFSGRMGAHTHAGVAGRFTYEPPPGVVWSGQNRLMGHHFHQVAKTGSHI